MARFRVSLYAHGMVTVEGDDIVTEDDALAAARKVPHDQVCWEDEYEDMEAFPPEE